VTVVGMVTLALVLGLGAWVTVRALGAALRSDIQAQNDEVIDSLAQAIADGADVPTLRLPLGADGTEFLIIDEGGALMNASVYTFLPGEEELIDLMEAQPGVVVFESGVVSGPVDLDATDFLDAQEFSPESGIVLNGVVPVEGSDAFFVDADDWFETERTVLTPAGDELTVIALSPLGIIGRSVDRLGLAMLLIVPLLVLAGGGALWWAVGAALAPVGRITDEANRIAPSNSGDRLPVPASGDEIAELAETLNGMLDRLDAGLVRQRQFVSDASHELRSPLTAVRGAAGLLADRTDLPDGAEPSVAALVRGSTRLEAVLDDLTELAAAGASTSRRDVDLADLIAEEAESVRSASDRVEAGTVEIGLDRVEPLVVRANPVQLGRSVANLLSNAARHARTRVEVGARANGGRIEIVVDDDGDGVPAQDRDRIFERFIRLDDARSRDGGGSGLGLAIVASIVAEHGGTVGCEPSPLGGARFVIRLPGVAAPSSTDTGSRAEV
jgi:signal transduction histidine kinase